MQEPTNVVTYEAGERKEVKSRVGQEKMAKERQRSSTWKRELKNFKGGTGKPCWSRFVMIWWISFYYLKALVVNVHTQIFSIIECCGMK